MQSACSTVAADLTGVLSDARRALDAAEAAAVQGGAWDARALRRALLAVLAKLDE